MSDTAEFDSPEDALADMREYRGRSIVLAEYAYGVADAFDVDRDDLSVRPAREFGRALIDAPPNEECISISELARDLVRALDGEPTTSAPYIGTGTSADHIGDSNLDTLEAMLEGDS